MRSIEPSRRAVLGFVAGVIAVLIFHQGAWATLHLAGLMPPPFPVGPTPPWGVPETFNFCFWGGLWGLFLGGLFLTLPAIGPVVVLGSLAALVVSAIEGAVVAGGLSALGAALVTIGIPGDSVIKYEAALKADSFLMVAHGAADEMTRAKAIIETTGPTRIDLQERVRMPTSATYPANSFSG